MSFKEFLMKFLKHLKIKILIQGNFTKTQALEITENVLRNLKLEISSEKTTKNVTINQIPLGSTYLRVKSIQPNDKNSVIKNYYQVGRFSSETECSLELLMKVMREPLFNFIRTQKQLGYSVSCAAKNDQDILGFSITVESQEKRHSAWSVDKKIEEFLHNFQSVLQDTNEEDFETMKHSIAAQKRSPDNSLETEVNRNWIEIKNNKFMFERHEFEARQLEILRKNDLLIFFKDHFSKNTMKKLSIQMIANADDDSDSLLQHGYIHLNLLTDDKHNTIKNISHFKNSLVMFD